MKPVQIIGGGITGLTAAWRLQARGIPFELFESSNRVGGVIRTRRSNGFVVESGPNTILETSAEVTDLIRDLGLQHRRIYPSSAAAKRYIAHAGVPVALPQAAIEAVKTPLLSFRGKLRRCGRAVRRPRSRHRGRIARVLRRAPFWPGSAGRHRRSLRRRHLRR